MQTAIMDSSPQPAPERRPLKRSASTASLPTPPYYAERRKRRSSSSNHESDSDSDDNDELDSDGDIVERTEEDQHLSSKRLGLLGASAAPPSHKRPKLSKDKTTSDTDDAEDKGADDAAVAGPSTGAPPISPPRSKGVQTRSATKATRAAAEVVAPRTPPRRAAKSKAVNARRPVRGSPDNPFLDDGRKAARPPPRRASEEFEEKPTVAYVFRGVKATFDNPLYGLSPSVRARARLPMDDPEFSPDPAVPPRRLLFNKEDTRESDDEDESDGGASQKVRPKRLFATTSAAAR